MNKKGFLDISFSWMFAIIAGVIILVLAIYAVNKFTGTQNTANTAEGAKEIGILMGNLEIGLKNSEASSITMPVNSKIYTDCNSYGRFGKQSISLSEKFKGKWSMVGPESSFLNKYIFLKNGAEGKKFFVFSKPFKFPFNAGSLIYLTSSDESYCFPDAPTNIKNELKKLHQSNLHYENCSSGDVNVCFGNPGCKIYVNENKGFVEKNGDRLYFKGEALMFGAIFSNKELYDCQSLRLMKRVGALTKIYIEKDILDSRRGCSSDVSYGLNEISSFVNSFNNSEDFKSLGYTLDELRDKNSYSDCRLW